MSITDVGEQIADFLEQYTGDRTYWYPLCVLKKPISVAAYNLDKIYKENKIAQIEAALRSCDIHTVQSFQMQTGNQKLAERNMLNLLYEKDDDGYNFPWYVETYYFDSTKKWMIYVSHEGTITFTGNALVHAAKENIQTQFLYPVFKQG